MLTLALLQLVINFFDFLLTHLLNPIYSTLMNWGSTIPALQVPAIIYSTFSICFYFLPMSTIFVLLGITLNLVGIAFIFAIISGITKLIKRVPLL